MKITRQELIEFVQEQELGVFGQGELNLSKMKALQRLIQKGLLPKPHWEGGRIPSYWEKATEIKERIIWIDEMLKKGLSFRQIKEELTSEQDDSNDDMFAQVVLNSINSLIGLNKDNIELLILKSKILYLIGKREDALEILYRILHKNSANNIQLFVIYNDISRIFHNMGNAEKEIDICHKIVNVAREIGDNIILGDAYLALGNSMLNADTNKAYSYFQKSIDLLENTSSKGEAYFGMYLIYEKQKDYAKAENYLKKSIEIFVQTNNKPKECAAKGNLGRLYYQVDELNNSMSCYNEAFNIAKQIHDLDAEAAIKGNIGKVYSKKGLYLKAIEHFRHAYHISSRINNLKAQEVWLLRMSEVYMKMGNTKKSNLFLEESKKISESHKVKNGKSIL